MLYCGIDQHKRTSVITTYDVDGQLVKRAKLPNDRSRRRAYFHDRPSSHKAVDPLTIHFLVVLGLTVSTSVVLSVRKRYRT